MRLRELDDHQSFESKSQIEITNRNSRSRIEQDIENFDDKFDAKRRIRNSRHLNRELEIREIE